jgi:hypothetical protein
VGSGRMVDADRVNVSAQRIAAPPRGRSSSKKATRAETGVTRPRSSRSLSDFHRLEAEAAPIGEGCGEGALRSTSLGRMMSTRISVCRSTLDLDMVLVRA